MLVLTDILTKVVIAALSALASALALKLGVLVAKPLYRFVVSLIAITKQHESLRTYADLEEILGDFLEKYRHLTKTKPLPSRWGFVFMLVGDAWGLCWGLSKLAIQHLLTDDNTRA